MNRQLLLKELRQYGKLNEVPNITEINASFLKKLIKINKTQNMLEIGSANGLSAIEFGITLEETGGKLKTIEFSANSHNQAVENIKKASLEKTVEAILGNALEIIPLLQEKYDFVFIDGMKRRSKDFLELVWNKVDNNGVIVIDDVIKFREKMVGLYEYLEEKNIDFTVIPVDIDDGVMIIVR